MQFLIANDLLTSTASMAVATNITKQQQQQKKNKKQRAANNNREAIAINLL